MLARPIAGAIAVALTIGACGDSDGGSAKTTSVSVKPSVTTPATTTTETKTTTTPKTTPAKKVTKAEVVATGDKACKANKSKKNRLDRVGSTASQIAALATQTNDRLVAKYVDVLNNELGLLRRLDYARKHKQQNQVDFLLSALAKQRHRARVIARDYGFQVCKSG
jgi:hypothetical protein